MPLRVIQFSTGNVGRHASRSIVHRPDLELVGVHASSPDKVGRDAADLCGLADPTGIVATDDLDALVTLRADCVIYTSQAETRPDAALAEITAFLAAGTNVVGTSLFWLVYPPHADAWLRDPIEAACAAGGTTMYVNGIDPGFSGDLLPLAALSLTERAGSILVPEICDYGPYDDAEFTGVSFGFGTTPDDVPTLFLPGVLASIWGGPVQLLADELVALAHLVVGNDFTDHNEAGVIATAAKAVNAIAAVCAAPPGHTSLRDLPVSQVQGLMR